MVAKEVFVNYHNFNPIWVQDASIFKSTGTQVKMVIVKVSYKIYSEPELQFGFAAPWSRSRSRSRKK